MGSNYNYNNESISTAQNKKCWHVEVRMSAGSLFHTVAAATAKALVPMLPMVPGTAKLIQISLREYLTKHFTKTSRFTIIHRLLSVFNSESAYFVSPAYLRCVYIITVYIYTYI